jgi:uncharacterized protein with von Willebrand factor type A (vWA) domain
LLDQATFLGARAQGQRFCIVADCSGSMKGQPLEEVKGAVVNTLQGLNPRSQFYVIFFNTQAFQMPAPSWVEADPRNVQKLIPWLASVPAKGNTNPIPALQMAFQLQPRPDAIFFMTDGIINPSVNMLPQVARMNQGKDRVAIHSILVTRGKGPNLPAAQQLRMLAQQNGGTFREILRNR